MIRPARLLRSAIVLKPSTIMSFHRARVRRKYEMLFTPKRRRKPGEGRKNLVQSGGESINVMQSAKNRMRYESTTALRRGSLTWTWRSLSTTAMRPPAVVIANVFVD
jgi:hypothetical protein